MTVKFAEHAGFQCKDVILESENDLTLDDSQLIKENKLNLETSNQSVFYLNSKENTDAKNKKYNSEIKALQDSFD